MPVWVPICLDGCLMKGRRHTTIGVKVYPLFLTVGKCFFFIFFKFTVLLFTSVSHFALHLFKTFIHNHLSLSLSLILILCSYPSQTYVWSVWPISHSWWTFDLMEMEICALHFHLFCSWNAFSLILFFLFCINFWQSV